VLAVIDVQDKMLGVMKKKVVNRHLHNMRLVIQTARQLEVPILVTEHYPKGLGPTTEAIERLLTDARKIEKIIFSCAGASGFLEALKEIGRKHVVLIGTETHVCVAQTAVDLLAEGYHVHVPADAVISRFKDDWRGGLDIMRDAGAVISRSETLVFQWLERAGTDVFRTVSPWIKERNQKGPSLF
jgi:nicotinamidase-related amidase